MLRVDKVFERAVAQAPRWDRIGNVQGPFGHFWHIASHVESVRPRELKKRAQKTMEHRGG
jgi:hypothetical protein